MGTYNARPQSSVIEIPGQNNSEWWKQYMPQTDYSYAGYEPYSGIDTGVNTQPQNNSGLLGSIGNYMGSDGMNATVNAITGAYGMYLGNRAAKDNEKNNSLYRKIMSEEHARTNKFRSDMSGMKFA